LVKIFFEIILNYQKIIEEAGKGKLKTGG